MSTRCPFWSAEAAWIELFPGIDIDAVHRKDEASRLERLAKRMEAWLADCPGATGWEIKDARVRFAAELGL